MKAKLMTTFLIGVLLLAGTSGVSGEYFDFGGATITIIDLNQSPAARFVEGHAVPTVGTAFGLHKEAEELFNCTIEFGVYSWSEYMEALLTRLLSGESENDIWFMNGGHFWTMVQTGAFFPMEQVLPDDYFDNLPGLAGGFAESLSFAGNNYGFGIHFGIATSLTVMAYMPEMFASLGLPDPQELYFAGEWTWDALWNIVQQAAADTTGDGIVDRFGLYGLGRAEYFLNFAYTNDYARLISERDGRLVFSGLEPNYLEAINTISDWNQSGLVDTRQYYGHNDSIVHGTAAMAISALSRLAQIEDEPYAIVPLPKGPKAEDYIHSSGWVGALVLPANARYPEGMVQLAHFLYPLEDYEVIVEDTYTRFAKDRTSYRILYDIHDNYSGWPRMLTSAGQPGRSAEQATVAAVAEGRPIASAMTEVSAAVQSLLDEGYND